MRITRSRVTSTMWAGGRPSHHSQYADVFFAARKAGLNDRQAMALACMAFDAVNENVEGLTTSTAALRHETLERKAADPRAPHSLWAYMRSKLGGAYRYITDEQIRETSMQDYAGWSAWAQKAESQAGEGTH